ncbi:MAG: membrane protein insertase YidC [Ignavibacteriaceae bacterium]
MDKQTTLAFVFIGLILIVWLYLTTPTVTPPQKTQKKNDTTLVQPKEKTPEPEKTVAPVTKETTNDSLSLGVFFSENKSANKIITIETDLAVIQITSQGAKIDKYFLKKYNNWYHGKLPAGAKDIEKYVQLINYSLGGSFDIAFISSEGKAVSTSDLSFETYGDKSNYTLTGKDSLTLTFTFSTKDSNSITKSYTFYGDRYDTRFELELDKMNNLISNSIYDIVWNGGLNFVEENSSDEANYSNASIYYGDEQVIFDAPHGDGEILKEEQTGRVDWLTVRNKYFAGIIVPEDPSITEGVFVKGYSKNFAKGGIREYYDVRLKIPIGNQQKIKHDYMVYIGPVSYDILDSYGRNLEKVVDFGSFFGLKFIVRPIAEYLLLPLFNFLHSFISNFGLVIILFSIIIKLLMYPLTKQSMQSMKKMQSLQPKIAELKEKFKDDQGKVQKETMKLYSTYGINPAGGCLPLLLQMPIFIALWGLFQSAIELRQQPFFWWISDLSKPDVIFNLGFKLPLFGIEQISGLALLMGITTYLQQKQTVKDPQQQMLVYIMPVMLTMLFMSFPSGLNLYYFLFNLFSIVHQHLMNKYGKAVDLQPVKNSGKKKGFMSKMMEAAEEKAKQQQKRKK